MTLDQVQGTARQGIGRAKEAIGEAVGNPGLRAKGFIDEATGIVQDTYGRVSDTARQVADRARSARGDLENVIDQNPVLVAAIALGVGIAIGLLVFGASRAAYDRR